MAAPALDFGVVAPATGPAVAEIYRLVQITRFGSEMICMNTFHFGVEAPGASAAGLSLEWATNVVPIWKANVTGHMGFIEVHAQRIAPTFGEQQFNTLSGTGGLIGFDTMPCVTAGVITWRTQYPGRTRRGRTFVAGLAFSPTRLLNYSRFSNVNVGNLQAIGDGILNHFTLGANPGGFYLGVFSKKRYFATDPPDMFQGLAMVNRITAQSYICTMGTRRYGRGM